MSYNKLNPKNWIAVLIFGLLIFGCTSNPYFPSKNTKNISDFANLTKVNSIDDSSVLMKMQSFRAALESQKGHLSNKDWQLHDELLNIYIQLSKNSKSAILIPAKSRLTTNLSSFCLNSSKASPEKKEIYKWVKGKTEIPYLNNILAYFTKNPNLKQSDIQTLIWNLQNETKWEDYPEHMKAILKTIDENASIKLPSDLKDKAKNILTDLVLSNISDSEKIINNLDIVKGKYYEYKDIKRAIEKLKSNELLPPENDVYEIPGTSLYSNSLSNGFSGQQITFYNPSNNDVYLDPTEYYLQPTRSDVQRIAITFPQNKSNKNSLISDLENLLFGDMLRLGIGFTPGLNDVADIYELLLGKDFVSSKQLTSSEQLLSGLGLIAGSGAGYRYAQRMLSAPAKYASEFEKGFFKIAKKELPLSAVDHNKSSTLLKDSNTLVDGVKKSPTLNKIFEANKFKKTDFYIRPNGDVIPSKGYRYIPSDAPYKDQLLNTGKIPKNPNGTYLSFDKYDQQKVARDALQLYEKNDAGFRLEFDTMQIIDDIRIPNGKFGTADYLEPLARDFEAFGVGNGTQAITNNSIGISRITDMKSGKTIYEAK